MVGLCGLIGCGGVSPARRGDRCFARGEIVSAIWHYGEAIEQGNTDPDVAYRRAAALRLMRDDRGAERDLVRAARWGSLEARGLLMLQRGIHDLDTARALADRHPDKSWAWSLYGDCLLAANRPDDAALVYGRALRLDPTTDLAQKVRHNLILALLRDDRIDAAERHLNDYLTLLDGSPEHEGRSLAGLLAYARGNVNRARLD